MTTRILEPKDRVKCRGFYGTIREVIRQRIADDLFVIDWDEHPTDQELYSYAALTFVSRPRWQQEEAA